MLTGIGILEEDSQQRVPDPEQWILNMVPSEMRNNPLSSIVRDGGFAVSRSLAEFKKKEYRVSSL